MQCVLTYNKYTYQHIEFLSIHIHSNDIHSIQVVWRFFIWLWPIHCRIVNTLVWMNDLAECFFEITLVFTLLPCDYKQISNFTLDIKFGLSEKHTKFEKKILMVCTFTSKPCGWCASQKVRTLACFTVASLFDKSFRVKFKTGG